MSVGMCVPLCLCGGEKKLASQFSPCTMWIPEIKLKSSGLAAKCLYLLNHPIGPY